MKMREVREGRSSSWVCPEGTHFIVVDLDVFSRRRLTGLVEALGDKVFVLHEGKWGSRYSANLELDDNWNLTADQEIRRLVALVRALPVAARDLWTSAQSRVFNIGVQAGHTPLSHELKIARTTVEAVADVQGSITITTYAPDEEADKLSTKR